MPIGTEKVKARPLGRPPKAVEDARTRRTATFLTEEEYQRLIVIAEHDGTSISAAAHKLIIQSMNTREPFCSDSD